MLWRAMFQAAFLHLIKNTDKLKTTGVNMQDGPFIEQYRIPQMNRNCSRIYARVENIVNQCL